MNIHKLHIFAKNRDAIASQKGFTFQQLKTLEDWIENRIANSGIDIYCDFEDDILAKDLIQSKNTFKQIKLYSTNFSFSSEAIKKAISHFFSLHVKGEYSFDQMEYIFETNSGIVGKDMRGNDADLLREWYENISKISDDLLLRLREKIKAILSEYIAIRNKELDSNIELKAEVQKANIVFENLQDADFDMFIKCIQWHFEDIDSNMAVAQLLKRIHDLIPKIPLPLISEKIEIYSSLLVREVFLRSAMDDSDDRKLSSDLLDTILLSSGEEEDKLYAEVLDTFKSINKVEKFYYGQFQSVITATRYCRWKNLDVSHRNIWLDILKQYLVLEETPVPQKRRAIYEYLFLKISSDPKCQSGQTIIGEDLDLVQYYFNNWLYRDRLLDLEYDITMLHLMNGQMYFSDFNLPPKDLKEWETQIDQYLMKEYENEENSDRKCELLELQGHLAFQKFDRDKLKSIEEAFFYYRQIPLLLKTAKYYSLANLYGQLKELIKNLINVGGGDEVINMLDEFSIEIQEYAHKSGLAHESARELVQRACLYLKNDHLASKLSALELLHRSKDLWRSKYTYDPYVQCLISIADLYSSLGMTYASKYYALVSSMIVWHSSDSKLYKYLQRAFALIQKQDFKHGAWLHALYDFESYLIAKENFQEVGVTKIKMEEFGYAISEIATIMICAPFLLASYNEIEELFLEKLGHFWENEVGATKKIIANQITDESTMKKILCKKLVDSPFNDIGLNRSVEFNALGNHWCITFDNNSVLNSIGEEFISCLQITLTEIAYKFADLFKQGKSIYLTIENGHCQKEQIAKNRWLLTIPEFNSYNFAEIQLHYAGIDSLIRSILQPLTEKSMIDFIKFYRENLLEKAKIGIKYLEGRAYQCLSNEMVVKIPDDFVQRLKILDKSSVEIIHSILLKQ